MKYMKYNNLIQTICSHLCAREMKKLWNMKVKIVPIVIGVFGTITKGLLKGLQDLGVGGLVDTIQIQHYWEQPEYWEASWRLEETCCHSNASEKPSAKTDAKNSKGVNNNNNNNSLSWIIKKFYLTQR